MCEGVINMCEGVINVCEGVILLGPGQGWLL